MESRSWVERLGERKDEKSLEFEMLLVERFRCINGLFERLQELIQSFKPES